MLNRIFGTHTMANFGIAEELVVVSESVRSTERTRCRAQRSTLSVTGNCIDFENLPTAGVPGTDVTAVMQAESDSTAETSMANKIDLCSLSRQMHRRCKPFCQHRMAITLSVGTAGRSTS